MLKYSAEASELKPKFYKHYNSLDIYVEDEGDEVFYEVLLGRLLGRSIRVGRVFGVGGKANLLAKLDRYLKKPATRKVFFIADGDLDRILRRKFPKTDYLFVLGEYCIENYLFEENAIYDVMQEEASKTSIKDLKGQFAVNVWLADCVDTLTPLFACFVLIQKYHLGKNVKAGLGRFLSGTGIPVLDRAKIVAFVSQVRTSNPTVGDRDVDDALATVERIMGNTWRKRKRYICGKNYLLPLLRFEVKRNTSHDIKPRSFRFRIMKNCRFRSLSRLMEQIEKVAAG